MYKVRESERKISNFQNRAILNCCPLAVNLRDLRFLVLLNFKVGKFLTMVTLLVFEHLLQFTTSKF